jgi:hypothetical protein
VLAASAWVTVASVVTNVPVALSFWKADSFAYESDCWYLPSHSTLYLPIQQFPQLTLSTAVVTLFCCGVFTYLAMPLARSAIRLVLPRRSWAAGWRI